jgi:hypothetical protein
MTGKNRQELLDILPMGSIMANSEPGFFRVELLHHFVGL